MNFEPVLELHDFYDGPRDGIANYNGLPHLFKSLRLDTVDYRGEFESADIFVLTPLAAEAQPSFRALATFVPVDPDIASGGYQVAWQVIVGNAT